MSKAELATGKPSTGRQCRYKLIC